MPTVNDIVLAMEELACPSYAYDWDNCGLLVGARTDKVSKVLVVLDVTLDTVNEAIELGCDMMVSHHPLIFKGIRSVTNDTCEGELISLLLRHGIALYSAHTSLDIASGGVNDALAEKLGLKNIRLSSPFDIGGETVACARIGELESPLSKIQLLDLVSSALKCAPKYNLSEKNYSTVCVSGGAGEEFGFGSEADVFITGEIKYHTALELKRQNISFIAAGHYNTEVPVCAALCSSLQKRLNVLQYNVTVYNSKVNTNPFEN